MGNGISKSRDSSVISNHSSHYSLKRSKSKRNQKLKLERYWIHATDVREERTSRKSDVHVLAASQALTQHRQDLQGAIEDTASLTHSLISNNIIPESTKRRLIVSGLTGFEINIALLDAVEARIRTHPRVFDSFLDLLKGDIMLQSFAGQLLESYREFTRAHAASSPMALTLPPLAQYADYLKAIYSTLPTLKKYNLSLPMPSKKNFNLVVSENQTIEENQSDDQQRVASRIIKRRIDIAEIFKHGRAWSKTILVEGLSGAGKSTLATYICRGWDKMEVLEGYSLVVLLRVEEIRVQEAKKLADIFYHPNSSLQATVVEQVVRSEGEGVLLIIDGIDQLPPPQLESGCLLAQILQRSCLSKATLLLTGHPRVSTDLLSNLNRCVEIDMHVELRGFSSEDIEQHAECVLGHDDDLIEEFTTYISENPVIRRLMRIPLNTTTVIEVFKTARALKKPLPKTMTQLYAELCRHLLKYYMLVKGVTNTAHSFPENLEKLPRKVYQQMRILAQLAFDGLVKQETVFYNLPRDCKHLGFLNASYELHVKKGTSVAYSFLHLGLQEYLAAFHVSQLSPPIQTEIFQQYSALGLAYLQNMWKSLAGLTGFRSIIWDLAKARICTNGTLNPFVLQCMYEAHECVTCEHVVGTPKVVFSQLQYGDQFLPIDCYALGCCLAHSACNLSLRMCLDAEMLRMLALGLKSSGAPIASTIETVFLRLPVTCTTVDRLTELPPNVVQGLDLSHTKADQSVITNLAKSIPTSMPSLKHLEIRGNPIGQGGLVLPLHSLLSSNHLHSLSMINTEVGYKDIAALANLTMPGGSLKELRVGDEQMPHECVKILVSTVFANSSLDTLHLWLVDLQSHVDLLSSLLESNCNLRKLEFHGCRIGSEGSQKLAEALKQNITLKTLVISSFDVPTLYHIGTKGATALSEMLKVNQRLECLELLFDESLGRAGALALITALQHNHGLKYFKLPQHYFSSVEILAMDVRVKWSSP